VGLQCAINHAWLQEDRSVHTVAGLYTAWSRLQRPNEPSRAQPSRAEVAQHTTHQTLFKRKMLICKLAKIPPRPTVIISMERRMLSHRMLHHVALVRTEVSEELSASIIRVTRIGELGTALAVTSNRRTLRINTIYCCTVTLMMGGGNTLLRNVGSYKSHAASYPRRRHSS
jgi:hypothetical protein